MIVCSEWTGQEIGYARGIRICIRDRGKRNHICQMQVELYAQCDFYKVRIHIGKCESVVQSQKKKSSTLASGRWKGGHAASFLFSVRPRFASFNLHLELKLPISNHQTISRWNSRITRKRVKSFRFTSLDVTATYFNWFSSQNWKIENIYWKILDCKDFQENISHFYCAIYRKVIYYYFSSRKMCSASKN